MRGSTEGIHTQATPQEKVGPKQDQAPLCAWWWWWGGSPLGGTLSPPSPPLPPSPRLLE
jgi:hypothetical protein